jgi:hypothetical protein
MTANGATYATVPAHGVFTAYRVCCESDHMIAYGCPLDVDYSVAGDEYTVDEHLREGATFVNGPEDVAVDARGRCLSAREVPALALCNAESHAMRVGAIWGRMPGTFKLYPGIPGFRIVGFRSEAEEQSRTATSLAFVVQDLGDEWVRFQLTKDLTAGGKAQANILRWDPTTNSGDGDFVDSGDEVTVRDATESWGPADSGTKGWYQVRGSTNGPVYMIMDLEICPQ